MSAPTVKRRKLSTSEDKNGGEQSQPEKLHHKSNKGLNQAQDPASRVASRSSAAEYAVASGQYKSNIFKFRIDELLGQLRLDYDKHVPRVEKHLRKLRSTIENIPNLPPKTLSEVQKEFRKQAGVAIPFPEHPPNKSIKYSFEYAKPANINVVGSFALRTGVKGLDTSTIDLAVTIPSSILQKKDYLNHRYFYKRAYYLACIAAGIKKSKKPAFNVSYVYQDGNTLQPILLVEPTEDSSNRSNCCIRILTAIDSTTFPISHTLPLVDNLRQGSADDDQPEPERSMTVYNSTLRSNASITAYLNLLHAASLKCAAYKDSCILGRAWLRQRGFGSSFSQGGFGHFEWATLVALLLEGGGSNQRPLLSPSYSSYQIFKTVLQFLSRKDLTVPFLLNAKITPQTLAPSGCPVMFDGTQGLNILYKMTPWSYGLLRHESAVTLKMLNDPSRDHFDSVFIVKSNDSLCRFDQMISFKFPIQQPDTLQATQYLLTLHRVLSKALGNRVNLVNLTSQEPSSWAIESRSPSTNDNDWVITAGLKLNSDNRGRVVDHGPSVEDKDAAAAFRKFWGDKAELRRFKDGSIVESLVWSDHPSSGPVVQQIVEYITPLHFEIPPEGVSYAGCDLNMDLLGIGSPELHAQDSQHALDAFQTLERQLQDLDLPLVFRHLSASTPLLRYSSPESKIGGPASAPLDVTLQFEDSTRWPDNLTAIQMTKVAILIKVGESLESLEGIASCRVGVENTTSKIVDAAYLDIHCSSSITFRLHIYHDREQELLERQLKDKELGAPIKEELAVALATHKRNFIQRPRHSRAIQTLSTRFPALSPTIRLFKHWVNSHLFTPFFHEELLELFVCQVFLSPYPWEPPSNAITAFLRTLHQLSRWDWQHEPFIVNFSGDLTSQDFSDIETHFNAWRKIDPAMKNVTIFAASNLDPEGVTWSQFGRLPKVVASKFFTLAKAASKLVRQKGTTLRLSDLFRSPLSDYDFALHIHPALVSRRSKQAVVYKNLQDPDGELKRYDTITAFVGELNRLYGEYILFFHGHESGKVIAGLWNPQTTKPRSFALKVGYSTYPSKKTNDDNEVEEKLVLNKTAILNGIASIAGDIISKIEVIHR